MPRRNAIKIYGGDQYYHCYNRGTNKDLIFRDKDDYGYFLSLFKRHLSNEVTQDKTRRAYQNYKDEVELIAYCLMPNHYHLLLYNKEVKGIERLMRSVMTAYSRYFNLRHGRTGTLFESHFLASRITSDEYLWHISRYIHLNPLDIGENPSIYDFSSLRYFIGSKSAEWIHPERIIDTRPERDAYTESLKDGEDYHKLRHQLLSELAS